MARMVELDVQRLNEHRVLADTESGPLLDRYKLLKTQILQSELKRDARTLMITSAVMGEGKSTTSLNLAVAFSQEIDRKVLLVEADLAHPSFGRILDLDPDSPGLVDHLLDGRPLEDLLIQSSVSNLMILPAGRSVPNSGELLGSRQMKKLVDDLKGQFPDRFIIFDTSPVIESADALVFSELVDAILLVVAAGETPVSRIRKAQEILENKNLIGLMLNKARREPATGRKRP